MTTIKTPSTQPLMPTGYTLYHRDVDGSMLKVQGEDYTPSGRAILEALARHYRNSYIITTFRKKVPVDAEV